LLLTIQLITAGVLLSFSLYFFLNEFKQFLDEGLNYFSSIWNYIDILCPLGVSLIVVFVFIDLKHHDTLVTIQGITTFCMWIKLFYFLRMFKATGFLIRIIIEVIKDMKAFLFILLVAFMAFGDAFYAISPTPMRWFLETLILASHLYHIIYLGSSSCCVLSLI